MAVIEGDLEAGRGGASCSATGALLLLDRRTVLGRGDEDLNVRLWIFPDATGCSPLYAEETAALIPSNTDGIGVSQLPLR